MFKIQSIVIMLSVIMLTIMGVASTMKVVPIIVTDENTENADSIAHVHQINVTAIKQESLDKLSIFITKMILEYLEIETCFEYILQTRTCFYTHRPTVTRVAYQHYVAFLMFSTRTPSTNPLVVLTRLHQFLQTPLDRTVPFPEPTLQILGQLRALLPYSETSASIQDFFHHFHTLFAYEYTAQENNVGRYWGPHLPLVYDTRLSLLQLYPMDSATYPGIHQHVHLPAVLIFRRAEGADHVEHVWQWVGCCWKTFTYGSLWTISTITWITIQFRWLVQMCILETGRIQTLRVVDFQGRQYRSFRLTGDNQTYVLVEGENQDDTTPEFTFTSIVAYYYPSDRDATSTHVVDSRKKPPHTNLSTTKEKKPQYNKQCCNIV